MRRVIYLALKHLFKVKLGDLVTLYPSKMKKEIELAIEFKYDQPPFRRREDLHLAIYALGAYMTGNTDMMEKRAYVDTRFISAEHYEQFMENFKQSDLYKYSTLSEEEDFVKRIQEKGYKWTRNDLKKILKSPKWYETKGEFQNWYHLAALLREGFITVKIQECPLSLPPSSEDGEEEKGYYYQYTNRASRELIFMRWCAFNWIRDNIDVEPVIDYYDLYATGYQVRVGDGDPAEVMDAMALHNKTYIQVPYGESIRLYTFEPTNEFYKWVSQDKLLHDRIVSSCMQIFDEEKQEVKRLEVDRVEKKRKEKERYQKVYCQIENHHDDQVFSTGQVADILKYDKTSVLRGQEISSGKIRDWIADGTLHGEKRDKNYEIKKKDLVIFLSNYMK